MSFTLVIATLPSEESQQELITWSSFLARAKIDALKHSAGVFYLSENAWLFDTTTALHLLGLVTYQAHELSIQIYTVQLDDETLFYRVGSHPPSSQLMNMLCSDNSNGGTDHGTQ